MKKMLSINNFLSTGFLSTGFLSMGFLSIGLLLSQTAIADISNAEIEPVRQNELLYFLRHDCGSCHGMTLKGGLGPALLAETLAGKPKSYIVTTIMEGHQDTAMPPWKSMLTYNEATWIAEQLQSGSIEQTKLVEGNKK
jgi:cytochrome c55X